MNAYEPPTFETLGSLVELTLSNDKSKGKGKGRKDDDRGFSR